MTVSTGDDAETVRGDMTSFTIKADDRKNLGVSFKSDASGRVAGSLEFESAGGNGNVALAGNGVVSAREITITPLSINFGDVGTGDG